MQPSLFDRHGVPRHNDGFVERQNRDSECENGRKCLAAHTLSEQRDLNEAQPLFEHTAQLKRDPEMVQLAVQLIDRQTGAYDPADLEDRYETRLRAMLDAKVQGQPFSEDAPAPVSSNVIDLMAALRKVWASRRRLFRQRQLRSRRPASVPSKRAQKATETERKQPGLKLRIEGGKKATPAIARVAEDAERASRHAVRHAHLGPPRRGRAQHPTGRGVIRMMRKTRTAPVTRRRSPG